MCVILVVALMIALAAWQWSSHSPSMLRLAVMGALALPLAATLPGLLRRNVYTARWASLLTVVYIGLGLMETTVSPDARVVGSAIAGLSFALFGALVLAIRRAGRK